MKATRSRSEQARLAYTIIESLLEHTRVISDLIALMAQTLDEDTTKALTQTPVWTAYLDSRRAMERTRADVERFAGVLNPWKTPIVVFKSGPRFGWFCISSVCDTLIAYETTDAGRVSGSDSR